MHNETAKPFPFRALLDGTMRGQSMVEIAIQAGDPDEKSGEIWTWRYGRDVPAGTLGDPRTVVVTLWGEAGRAAHAHLHLGFPDGLGYDEVVW